MTEHDILDAIGDIDPAYLEEVNTKTEPKKIKWWKTGSWAACLLLLLIVPIGLQHGWWAHESVDYAATEQVECHIYYVKDHALYYEDAGIGGGDLEMFEIWKEKNGIKKDSALQSIVLSPTQDGADTGAAEHYDTAIVKLSSSMRRYFENEDGIWRKEALKKTIASYRNVTINTIELIFV